MSFRESNVVTSQNPHRPMFGGGDGIKNDKIINKKIRNQIPSCRRFSTRPIQKQQEKANQVKEELQRAIKDLTKHPGITYRKSLTMAEITPTKNLKDKLKGTPINLSLTRSFEGASISCRKEDAGRRIYQLLLLNAWRRRKIQVVSLSDSLASLETQNNKLVLQVDALRRLRQAECEKRSEAVAESHILQNRLKEHLKEQQELTTKKVILENEVEKLKLENRKITLCVQNSKNDWMTAVNDIRHLEHQLEVEREKIKMLRFEKRSLLDQISHRDQDVLVQNDKILNLEDNAKNLELSLQDAILSKGSFEKEKIELLKKLEKEVSTNLNLQTRYKELQSSKETLEIKVHELRKFNTTNKEIKRKIEEENNLLEKKLRETNEALKEEQKRPWWRNASDLALAPLGILQSAAYIMLPALTNDKLNKTTSTSDLLTL